MDLTIQRVERIWVDIPFREVPARNMVRELPHWTLFEICKVHLACGVTGFGETMCYYTPVAVTDASVAKVQGKHALEVMWDDSLGTGLQMAIFDAVGKALDVPCHRLMGSQQRDRAFISWWAIDMPAEDWLLECQQAIDEGYTSFKTKARPWFDLVEQSQKLSEALPAWFEVDYDFNGMLRNTAHATRLLTEVEQFPHVAIYESPIPQGDVQGLRHLRQATRVPIALHFGTPPIMTTLREDVCDGFVISGGATRTLNEGRLAAAADKVFWLQHVGTGITATWCLHLAAVLTHARWPAVNCHQLFTEPMVRPAIEVSNGMATVPEAPGLGVELDEDAIERYRIEPKAKPYPAHGLLLAVRWPSGGSTYYTHTRQYWDDFLLGKLPVFPRGVRLEHVPDDGSAEWKELQQRAQQGGVHVGPPPR